MTVVAALAVLVILALVAALVLRERDHDKATRAREATWTAERHQLLNRIQRPELLPTMTPPPSKVRPAKDAREMARVGSVSLVPPAQRPGGEAA